MLDLHTARINQITLGWICAFAPILTVIVCATWAMSSGLVTACFPLIEGCLSISAACREKPVIYLFRTIMLPMSLVLVVFWWLNHQRLTEWIPDRPGHRRLILCLSVTGSFFLILYVIFLGTDGAMYEFLRRLGIYVFFGGTGFAQLFTTFALKDRVQNSLATLSTSTSSKSPGPHNTYLRLAWSAQYVIVWIMLLVGPLNLLLKEILDDARRVENVIEWNFGLIMFSWYALQAVLYQHLRPASV